MKIDLKNTGKLGFDEKADNAMHSRSSHPAMFLIVICCHYIEKSQGNTFVGQQQCKTTSAKLQNLGFIGVL